MKKYKLFLSYCSQDSDLADILEQQIRDSDYIHVFDISRYTRGVEYKESFIDYMDSIELHDFVITIITDAYLKSPACMYEVSQLLTEVGKNKFLYIVVDKYDVKYYSSLLASKTGAAKIYTPEEQLEYIKYWEKRRNL